MNLKKIHPLCFLSLNNLITLDLFNRPKKKILSSIDPNLKFRYLTPHNFTLHLKITQDVSVLTQISCTSDRKNFKVP